MAIVSFEHKIRVRYKDTDQMGIMHHSNYIVFYEMARTEWLRDMGLTYAEIERRGIMSPIIEVESRYLAPAYYDNEKGTMINRGSVTLGFMHADTRRPCRVPEWFMSALNDYISRQHAMR